VRLLKFDAIPGFGKWLETAASIVTVASVLVSATLYLVERPDRERTAMIGAWTVVTGMDGKRASGGRDEALRQLKAGGQSLAGIILDDAILEGIDLSNTKLAYSSLRNVEFSRCSLRASDLNHAILSGGHHRNGCDLRNANLEDAQVDRAVFADCACNGVVLYKAHGDSDTSFNGAVMHNASISNSSLQGAIFENADLEKSRFIETNVEDASFQRAKVSNWRWVGVLAARARLQKIAGSKAQFTLQTVLSEAHFDQSRLENAMFSDSNLRGASFFGAVLPGTIFKNCDLSNVDFTSADLAGVRFEKCLVSGAVFRSAKMDVKNAFVDCQGVPSELPSGGIR